MTILYSTGCPKCKVLKMKLDQANIEYAENNDVEAMVAKGITSAPALAVDGVVYSFTEAIHWISETKMENT